MNDTNESLNQGIIVTGGTINADQIAVGTNAKAQKIIDVAEFEESKKTLEDLRKLLSNLRELMQINSNVLASGTEEAIDMVRQEAEKDNPNKIIMKSILDGVITSVKSVSSIASAVSAVKKLVDIVIN